MNQLTTVNSYTVLASIIRTAIATRLVLITALFAGEKAPAIADRSKLTERVQRRYIRPFRSALLVGSNVP